MEENNISTTNKKSITIPAGDYESVEFSNHELHSSTNHGEIPSCGSMDSLFDELRRETHACTHFHTCNAPGPEFPHTHTCVHMHTKLVSPSINNDGPDNDDSAESSKKPNGRKRGWKRGSNREAVRKYRQKKKAYTVSLANEVASLRAMKQQLIRRLQRQVPLESEVARVKCLLVDIRGRIEGEIGSFPYQKAVKIRDMYQNIDNVQCGDQICLQADGKSGQSCEFQNHNCMPTIGSPPS